MRQIIMAKESIYVLYKDILSSYQICFLRIISNVFFVNHIKYVITQVYYITHKKIQKSSEAANISQPRSSLDQIQLSLKIAPDKFVQM